MARPFTQKEPINQQYVIRFTESQMEQLRRFSLESRRDMSRIIRDAVEREITESRPHGAPVTLTQYEGAPCGEWREAIEDSTVFEISGQLASMWGVNEHHQLLHTTGLSMFKKGIPDNAILLMEEVTALNRPKDGDICAVIATFADDTRPPVGTVKEWHWRGDTIELRNGDGKKIDAPAGAVMLQATAIWTGHLIS